MDRYLRKKWAMLKFWESCLQNNVSDSDKLKITIANAKRAIRKHNKRIERIEDTKIICSETDGYFLELVKLPAFVKSLSQSENYFKEELFLPRICSLYDCTGHCFTINHKCIKRGDAFYVYHEVGQDV